MSELIQQNDNRATIRWKLLTGTSAMALAAYVASTALARADDVDRPQLWIELGGQMELMQGTASTFTAPFFSFPTSPPAFRPHIVGDVYPTGTPDVYGRKSFAQRQVPPRISVGGNASITFQPEDSDWVFSAAIRYGRSHSHEHSHYQQATALARPVGPSFPTLHLPAYNEAFSDVNAPHSERHIVLDFQAGKDIGLGLFGQDGKSTVSAGVRFASFKMSSATNISARPSVYGNHKTTILKYNTYFHSYHLAGHQKRSFQGIGPSLSWEASAAIAGNSDRGELMLDWGIDGAMLFGRQEAKTDHHTSAHRYKNGQAVAVLPNYPRNYNAPSRSRRVTVPELSGFIGLSAKLPHSKVSIGYRGDIWFNAMDTGIDAARKSNLTFNGPYASISIGLGD